MISLAQAYFDNKDYQKAVDISRDILQINPDYSVAYRSPGRAAVKTEELTDAIKTYKTGIVVAGKNGERQVAKETTVLLGRLAKN